MVFQGYLKEVSKEFQGSFKKVSMVFFRNFQEGVKGVSREF